MSQLVGKRTKETPKDAKTPSHIYLLRGGYVRMVSTGIYSLLPIAKRVVAKIERIIREEMDRVDGQEVLMPVVLPRELWDESGRYESVGAELLRVKDRNGKDMLLGMTHEEAVCHLARSEVGSYRQLPFMLYQIQTKYRDEPRPRAGLIRVREFTMKDAYSFHETDEDLKTYYARVHESYERIFRRVGMKDVVSIESDTGMMGGSASHEFMAVSESGEDTIFLSPDGSYKANREVARTALKFEKDAPQPLEEVHTPGKESIEDVAAFLKVPTSKTGKAVFYADHEGHLVFAVIRGDIEVNEVKLKNYLKSPSLRPATPEEIRAIGAEPGYASPMGVAPKAGAKLRIVFDRSARESTNLVVGANRKDTHYRGFCFDRDMKGFERGVEVADIATAREGDPCPVTGAPLLMKRGIEVGNIFQLGTRYSQKMSVSFLDREGKSRPMIMGCYGIGVGRTMASVIEQSHDKFGPLWPVSIAPFHVQICVIEGDKSEVGSAAEEAYKELRQQGVEVLLDDRNEKPGSAFSDADLVGCPFRLVYSPRNMAERKVEFRTRDGSRKEMVPLEQVVYVVKQAVDEALRAYA